jgi:hypothetical protein
MIAYVKFAISGEVIFGAILLNGLLTNYFEFLNYLNPIIKISLLIFRLNIVHKLNYCYIFEK